MNFTFNKKYSIIYAADFKGGFNTWQKKEKNF